MAGTLGHRVGAEGAATSGAAEALSAPPAEAVQVGMGVLGAADRALAAADGPKTRCFARSVRYHMDIIGRKWNPFLPVFPVRVIRDWKV